MRTNARSGERFNKLINGRVAVFIHEPYEITALAYETKNSSSLRDLLNNVQRHHGMNLPKSVARKICPPV